jgi:beta-N-acetylhexosaminidase
MTAPQVYSLYLKDSQYLKELGLTTNFAPVVDVISRSPNPLPGRMYSSSPNSVSSYAGQYILAQKDAGITPVIKHFPGLGSATGNTDNGSATTDPLSVLKTRDLLPYQALASLNPDVMMSNAIVPELTNGQPAVWSSEAVKLLRSYGYNNAVVYTDSLTAKAIPGTLQDASLKAWQAGIDVAVIVQTKEQTAEISGYATDILTQAKTALQNSSLERSSVVESVARILARKNIDPCTIGGQ